MIDTKELRSMVNGAQFESFANSVIHSLLDRLEAAEKERDALRAKVDEMEWQEPVGEIVAFGESLHEVSWNRGKLPPLGAKLCLLPGAQPAPSFADAYQGAMEEVAIWKKRALEAEDLNRKFVAEINGPTYMGDPPHSKPDCGEAGHDEGRCGNRQCLHGAQGEEK